MQNYKSKFKIKFLLLAIFCLLFFPLLSKAAVLYLEPSYGEYQPGDTFMVEVRIDTEECINTVGADLSFPKDILEVIDFSQGNSILTLWVKSPEINQESGLISFIGGIPGGYCGILPGELGEPNLLGKIIFKVQELTQIRREIKTNIEFLDTSQVLLHDGLGTPAKLTTKGAVFTILPKKREVPKDEWLQEILKDTIPPESFEITIHQDPTVFEGKYFIIFSTTDKQTGIDYYEIKEGKADWKRGESPYLLEDQSLQSIIKVKAVDKAGNERIAEYRPPVKITWKDWLICMILVLVVGGLIWWIIRKLKIKSQKSK